MQNPDLSTLGSSRALKNSDSFAAMNPALMQGQFLRSETWAPLLCEIQYKKQSHYVTSHVASYLIHVSRFLLNDRHLMVTYLELQSIKQNQKFLFEIYLYGFS